MRVGVQSELGDIAIHTAMNRHELSAEISVQHAGLRDAIVAELPALQARLSEQHIPISSVAVTADAGGSSQGFQQSQQDGRSTAHYSAAMNNSSDDGSVREREAVSPVDVLGRGAGLDIRI
jgi:flagellar hook-length control protein FliK